MEKVVEIKIPPDYLDRDQERAYKRIAGNKRFVVLTPKRCGCPTKKRRTQPQRQPQPDGTAQQLGIAALEILLVLALILDDSIPGGQVDDVAIPPLVARIIARLAPILRGAPAL